MRIGILNLTYKNSIIKEHQPNNKMTQEDKNYLMIAEAEMGEMFERLKDLLSDKTLQAMTDVLYLFGEEVIPLWEEVIDNENKQLKLKI